MYDDLTPELVAARKKAVLLANRYIASFEDPADRREAILAELLGK
ncbi:MAG: maltose acetyltransferase domain-containing protein, partial [Hyphomicrobium sp.]